MAALGREKGPFLAVRVLSTRYLKSIPLEHLRCKGMCVLGKMFLNGQTSNSYVCLMFGRASHVSAHIFERLDWSCVRVPTPISGPTSKLDRERENS